MVAVELREGQPETPLEAEPRVVGILLGAEVDHRLDALPPQPPPSLLASRLPGPREPVLPDHPVVREGLARGCFRPPHLAGPRRWPAREGEQHPTLQPARARSGAATLRAIGGRPRQGAARSSVEADWAVVTQSPGTSEIGRASCRERV